MKKAPPPGESLMLIGNRLIYFGTAALALLLTGCGERSGHADIKAGISAYREGRYEKAAAAFLRATEHVTGSPELYCNMGLAYLKLGDVARAQRAFSSALEIAPGQGEALVCLGQIAYLKNALEDAALWVEKGIPRLGTPADRAAAYTTLGQIETARRRYDFARVAFLRAIRADRKYAPAYYDLATLYRDTYQFREEALDNFELYTHLADLKEPHREKALNSISRLKANIDRTRQALNRDDTRRDSSAAAALIGDALSAQLEKRHSRALRLYKSALAADPLAFNAAYGMAITCVKLNDKRGAVEAFKRALEINPNHQDCYLQAADLLLKLRQYSEATDLLDRAIARSPFNPESFELYARIRSAERHAPEAKLAGLFSLELAPPATPARADFKKWVESIR